MKKYETIRQARSLAKKKSEKEPLIGSGCSRKWFYQTSEL